MLPSIIIFFIVLSVLVLIHELGHFLAAKKAGILVEEFGFGYPPRIWGKKIGETIYSLNWIPFGGFVKLFGQELEEDGKIPVKLQKRAFFKQSKLARASVLLAGVFGNFLLGISCFTIIYSKTGIPQNLGYVQIIDTMPDSPARLAGLVKDEIIKSVNNEPITSADEFIKKVENQKGQNITLVTDKGTHALTVRENPPEGEGRLGVIFTDVKMVFYPWWKMIFWSVIEGTKEAVSWGWLIAGSLVLTIKQLFSGIVPQVAGPVGIYQITAMAARQGYLELLQFVGFFSINLAILNLVPFPALDGAHLVFVFIGDWMGKKRRLAVERTVNTAGFFILISLMLLVTIGDILRLLKTVSLSALIKPFSFLQTFFK